MHDGVTMEKTGVPAVSLVAPQFEKLALAKRDSMRLPEFVPVIVPADRAPVRYQDRSDELQRWVYSTYETVVERLCGAKLASAGRAGPAA